jgi:hypothetical protein
LGAPGRAQVAGLYHLRRLAIPIGFNFGFKRGELILDRTRPLGLRLFCLIRRRALLAAGVGFPSPWHRRQSPRPRLPPPVDPPQQTICRNAPFKVKQIEKPVLIAPPRADHGNAPTAKSRQTKSLFGENHEPFFSGVDPDRTPVTARADSSEFA